jgi:membrane-bound ClpP family serine protease
MAKNRDNTTTTTLPEGWRTTIDGWVRDPAIRRHGLIALAMLLGTTALVVGLATGALVATVNTLLPSLLSKTIAGGTLGLGSTGWLLHRRGRLPPKRT